MGGPEVSALNGLVAIVTGGASGIGAAIAQRLHADGASIAVLDRDTTAADPAFAAFTADVSDRKSVDAAVSAVAERFGRIDIVVNNAGIGAQGDITANDDDEWARVLSVNVTGIARVTSAALPGCGSLRPPRSATRHPSPRRQGCRNGRSTARRREPSQPSPARWRPTTCARASV